MTICPKCSGRGSVPCSNCSHGKVGCPDCRSSGTVNGDTCGNCGGSGRVNCPECSNGRIGCDMCKGTGYIDDVHA